jgi:hypothetical protein
MSVVGTVSDCARLVSRVEVEARAFRNADAITRHLRYGRVLGLLDAGSTLGLWSRQRASRAADGIYYGASPRALRGMLRHLR